MAVPGECSLSGNVPLTCAMWQKHCHQLKFSGTKHCSAGRCSLASFLQRDGGHGVLPPHAHPCMSRCSLGSATLGPGSNAKQSIPVPALLARACAHTHTPAHVCCLTRVGACFALGSVSLQVTPAAQHHGRSQPDEGETLFCICHQLRCWSGLAGNATRGCAPAKSARSQQEGAHSHAEEKLISPSATRSHPTCTRWQDRFGSLRKDGQAARTCGCVSCTGLSLARWWCWEVLLSRSRH